MSQAVDRAELRAAEAPEHRTLRRAAAVVLFALLTAVGAAVEIPIPVSPVPITLQTLFVSLSGLLLGARLGAASQALYVLAGALGAPVFSGGDAGVATLMGPTGGYLLAFPAAAAVTGALAARIRRHRTVRGAALQYVAILLGTAVIFVGGAAQLALLTGDPGRAIRLGVLPFIAGDLAKVLAALLVSLRLRDRTLGWL